jgi:hypothetical protein
MSRRERPAVIVFDNCLPSWKRLLEMNADINNYALSIHQSFTHIPSHFLGTQSDSLSRTMVRHQLQPRRMTHDPRLRGLLLPVVSDSLFDHVSSASELTLTSRGDDVYYYVLLRVAHWSNCLLKRVAAPLPSTTTSSSMPTHPILVMIDALWPRKIKAPWRDKTDVADRDLPCRLLLEISFGGSRVVWKKTPTVVTEEDYNRIQQKITKTADIHLRHRQNPKETAELRDVQKHDISVEGGLTLGGEHAIGVFQYDSPTPTVQTLGYINLPPTLYSGVAASCRMRFCYRPGQPGPIEESCLFHMSTDCWQSHFSLRHTGTGAIYFQICPSRHQSWEDRQQVVSATTFSPRPDPYEVVACVRADGSQALFVDGQLEATGAGVRGLTDGWDGRRTTNYIGRWMRPDQSYPLTASVLSLELFDGDLSAGSNQLDQSYACLSLRSVV